MKKVPYMIIVGEKEKGLSQISIRTREGKDIQGVRVEEFLSKLKEEITTRSIKSTIE